MATDGFGTEELVNSIISFVRTNINTKLAEIRTKKSLTTDDLKDVSDTDDAHLFMTMNETNPNRDVWVFYDLETPTAEGLGPVTAQNETLNVSIIFHYQNDITNGFKALRYRKALRELFEKDYCKVNRFVKITIAENEVFPVLESDPAGGEEATVLVGLGAGVKVAASWSS